MQKKNSVFKSFVRKRKEIIQMDVLKVDDAYIADFAQEIYESFFSQNAPKTLEIFKKLSALMCWDAIIQLGVELKLYSWLLVGREEKGSSSAGFIENRVINKQKGEKILSIEGIRYLNKGKMIAFYDTKTNKIVHLMLSSNDGYAFGTKNACVGIGSPSGFERIDLKNLKYDHNEKSFFRMHSLHKIEVYYRSYTDFVNSIVSKIEKRCCII